MRHRRQEIAVAMAKKEKEDAEQAAKEAAEREKREAAEAALAKLLAKANEVFLAVAGLDGDGESIRKEELVQAHAGDFKANPSKHAALFVRLTLGARFDRYLRSWTPMGAAR